MSTLNPLAREISTKIVYCGPALSGKTTSLTRIYESVRPQRRGQLVTLATQGDRTIFFDFLPLHVKPVRGLSLRFLLYTVPGQTFYAATRELVLKGADGIVFVADSSPAAREANLESWEELGRNVEAMGLDTKTMPIVLQWNKRDLPDAVPLEQLEREINTIGAPAFETVAMDGQGILSAFRAITKGVIRRLWPDAPAAQDADGSIAPSDAPSDDAGDRTPEPAPLPAPPRVVVPAPTAASAPASRLSAGASDSLVSRLRTLADNRPKTMPPESVLSFGALFAESEVSELLTVEQAIAQRLYAQAVNVAANAVASLLDALPGVPSGDSRGIRAMLLGLDGREYLKLSRLASLPEESIDERAALFALNVLVSARVKAKSLFE
jgi:signal recognition particle receptor subunit beta